MLYITFLGANIGLHSQVPALYRELDLKMTDSRVTQLGNTFPCIEEMPFACGQGVLGH